MIPRRLTGPAAGRSLAANSLDQRGRSENRAERSADAADRMNLTWLMPAEAGPMATTDTQPSAKIYVSGSRPDLRVPMREITLGGGESPLRLYDTSGPYTDPGVDVDVKQGIPPLRLPWILGRGDVEQLSGPSST